jgi:hypothetical protein
MHHLIQPIMCYGPVAEPPVGRTARRRGEGVLEEEAGAGAPWPPRLASPLLRTMMGGPGLFVAHAAQG